MDLLQARHDSPVMDTPEAAAYVGLAETTLETDRCTGRMGIPFLRLGRRIKYRRADLDTWLAKKAKAAA